MSDSWANKLYYGDNLDILREYIPDESVDLIYLDPPFNSKANYNILFEEKNGTAPVSQVRAFEDFWHWDKVVEETYQSLISNGPEKICKLMMALREFLGENDMMAYLAMMAIRLVEMHRVLKPTGSIYLHCDPKASHYLKLVMDAVFGPKNFRNEVIWSYRRYTAKSNRYQREHDVLLFYGKSGQSVFNELTIDYSEKSGKADSHYKQDEEGRWYRWQKRKGREPYKVYLSEGRRIGDVWAIPRINASAKERLGYPTQKPEALLERIIKASSNEGDIVMDPFCGCGTTVSVAERLKRRWIGIDITHLAIALMKNRLEDNFKNNLSPYEIIGVPRDLKSAEALAEQDKYQFQWWALSLIDARPAGEKKKGADSGIDGYIYFLDDSTSKFKKVVVQVKGGHVNASQIRDLKGVMEREKAAIGAFITLNKPTKPMITEAVSAGFYEPEILKGKQKFPRLQILTIDELLKGKKLELPRLLIGTFKRAERKSKNKTVQPKLIPE